MAYLPLPVPLPPSFGSPSPAPHPAHLRPSFLSQRPFSPFVIFYCSRPLLLLGIDLRLPLPSPCLGGCLSPRLYPILIFPLLFFLSLWLSYYFRDDRSGSGRVLCVRVFSVQYGRGASTTHRCLWRSLIFSPFALHSGRENICHAYHSKRRRKERRTQRCLYGHP